ncbi:hypothetical protein CEXT_576051 [Caerostris extrusa]|uniref:Uncharacterized protein n=1 Tax=Caerostris extrusa TaxID=172846 RepID=A0AAV4SDL1_CAEEX|nr:hypothetical protein CEXT_576051 [Caerostris extrusa]
MPLGQHTLCFGTDIVINHINEAKLCVFALYVIAITTYVDKIFWSFGLEITFINKINEACHCSICNFTHILRRPLESALSLDIAITVINQINEAELCISALYGIAPYVETPIGENVEFNY